MWTNNYLENSRNGYGSIYPDEAPMITKDGAWPEEARNIIKEGSGNFTFTPYTGE